MRLTEIQKKNLCRRYWEKGETFRTAKNRKGFATLHESDFKKITDVWSVTYRELYPIKSLEWLNQPDDNTTHFAHQTEEEIFNFRVKLYGKQKGVEWNTINLKQ